jgi:hypothetical protein
MKSTRGVYIVSMMTEDFQKIIGQWIEGCLNYGDSIQNESLQKEQPEFMYNTIKNIACIFC